MKKSDSDFSPLARGGRVPRAARPPGMVPPPRVVFRTRRKDLSHQNRVKRLDGERNLVEWQAFGDRFIREAGSLDSETAAYLIERGFDTDKGSLYSLPREDVDDYLSDLQVRLLPYANGADAPIVEHRQLFRQVFNDLLPWAPVLAVVAQGNVVGSVPVRNAGTEDMLWILPTVHGQIERMYMDAVSGEILTPDRSISCTDPWSALGETEMDAIVVQCPGPVGTLDRLRTFIVRDPLTSEPIVVAAVVAVRTAASGPFDTIASGAISAEVDVATGAIVTAKRVIDGAPVDVDASETTVQAALGQAVPHWWEVQYLIRQALLRLPLFSVLQMDFSIGGSTPLVVDATARVNAAEFQIHGPLMADRVCRRLMREYGL